MHLAPPIVQTNVLDLFDYLKFCEAADIFPSASTNKLKLINLATFVVGHKTDSSRRRPDARLDHLYDGRKMSLIYSKQSRLASGFRALTVYLIKQMHNRKVIQIKPQVYCAI